MKTKSLRLKVERLGKTICKVDRIEH